MQVNILLLVLLINTGLGQNDSPASTDMLLELKEQMAMMKESINNLIADNKALTERVNHLTLSQAEQRANNCISFTALATASRSYEAGATVIFDQEVVDYGNDFNPSSSIFTCPATAYYLFHASYLSGRDGYIGLRIYLDYDFIIGSYSDGKGNTYDTGSMLIVTRCEQGSSVSVKTRDAGVVHGTQSRETMFTGTLLALV